MCGITGILHFEQQRTVQKSKLKNMTDLLSHRGPDGEGFYLSKNVGLGHRRLSIIDLNTGDQPMFSDDKSIVLVFNGEIYNYIELKEELKELGHSFRTTSDTEIVIKAYQEWGHDCQNKFNGMWAFALWDSRTDTLFLSRDRIGEKPLHFAVWDNTLIFGSEIKSLFAGGVPKQPRLDLLEIYIVLKNIPAPDTFFKHINILMPGHFIIADSNGVKEEKYWDLPEIDEENMNKDKTSIYDEFKYLFEDSVRIRMRSDVPYGAFLSGGLDSSSVVALMSENSTYPVNSFTIGYDESEYDESKLAKLVADKFGTKHIVGKINPDSFEEILSRITFHYDQPFGDSSAIPTGYVSKFAAQHVKMVLTGDGGDEVLSGYSSYQGVKFAQKYKKLPSIVQKSLPFFLKSLSSISNNRFTYLLNRYGSLLSTSSLDFNDRLLNKRAKPNLEFIKLLVNADIQTWDINEYINDLMNKSPYNDDFYKLMYLNYKFDLPNDYLVKVDRMSMAYSLETRLPFLDHRLIEFMAGVDKNIKMEGWERKSVLKRTIANKLPPELLKASKKGFRVPVREWFKSDELYSKLLAINSKGKFLNSTSFKKIIDDNKFGKHDHGNLLWSLTVMHRIFDES